MKLNDLRYFNFNGGLRLDKSPYELSDNEVQKAVNVEFDEQGRITKREGYKAFGSTLSYTPSIAKWFFKISAGSYDNIVSEEGDGTNTKVYRIIRSPLNGAITTASTSVVVDDGTNFATSGTIEIEGDLIAYTGKSSNTLTGVTGISASHATDSPVRQWKALTTNIATRLSACMVILNENLFISGTGKTYRMVPGDAGITNNSTDYYYVEGYKLKLYATTLQNQILFSNAEDGTTWTGTDYFYATKGDGRPITGLVAIGNYLGIFKEQAMWAWDNYALRQRSDYIGAWNPKVINEVNGLTYFFGPRGIYATNGETISEPISDPVKPYIDDFTPTYDTSEYLVMNTSAGFYKNKYILHIGNTTTKHALTDVNLVYDTINKNWTTWTGLDADGMCFDFLDAQVSCAAGANAIVHTPVYLFGGSTNKQVYQYGGVYHDNFTDISAEVEFKPFHLNYPHKKKKFGNLKVFSERPGYSLYYKIDDQENWSPIGQVSKTIQKFPINKEGYKLTIKLSESSQNKPFIFNGFVFEDCITTDD